ncbi:hypothetical protein [Sphingomonas sanguinis]|uniref:hypothetical protein n=1 Tax=Sphingomonas sanguinis TaxID=33051 RepID=UPI00128F0A71|nr:hypothetical protein [Sphingomonas sanguinis]
MNANSGGIGRAIRKYWYDRSIISPFIFIILFFVFSWLSGALYVTFGPNADFRSQHHLVGHFLPHPSIATAYRFQKMDGSTILLNCEPRTKKSYCIDFTKIEGEEVLIAYAPYEASLLTSCAGVIMRITRGDTVVFLNKMAYSSSKENQSPLQISFWLSKPFLILAACFPLLVFIFIASGVAISIGRLFQSYL